MALPDERKFSFSVENLPADTFSVVKFTGSEGLSRLYRFDVELIAEKDDIDFDSVLQSTAVLTLHGEQGDVPLQGVVKKIRQKHVYHGYTLYRASLVPKLWWLTLTHHNQVFLDVTVKDIVETVLQDGGLTSYDYELRLQKEYPRWEYVCQYGETHFQFFSRWMEKYGLYYFFEHSIPGGKLIITDSALAHTPYSGHETMRYSQPSGLDNVVEPEVISFFNCEQTAMTAKVYLKDYNWEKPSLKITGEAQVKNGGHGQLYLYGEHFRTPSEGADLANIKAEELLCREKLFFARSGSPYLRPGFEFGLKGHSRGDYNQKYLVTDVEHKGDQTAYLLSSLQGVSAEGNQVPSYTNSSTSIPASVQFRPQVQTAKPKFSGTLHGKVDASSSGEYAELDEYGRYKIILPFDLSGRESGKASAWVRMMQPYAGSTHGMHYPLHKGTEVLLTFIDGDPDRPIIAGAVPNPETPSMVTSSNQTQSKLTTSGGNSFKLEDQGGSQHITLSSPTSNTYLRLGAVDSSTESSMSSSSTSTSSDTSSDTSDDSDDSSSSSSDDTDWYDITGETYTSGFKLFSLGDWDVKVTNSSTMVLGKKTSMVIGVKSSTVIGSESKWNLISKTTVTLGADSKYKTLMTYLVAKKDGVCGAYNKVLAAGTWVVAQATHVKENVSNVFTSKQDVIADDTKVIAEETEVVESSDQVIDAIVLVTPSRDSVVESDISVVSSQENIIDDQTDVISSRASVMSDETNVIDTKTDVIETESAVTSSTSIVTDLLSVV